MLAGALVQVVTGIALIASHRLQGFAVDETKMIVKLTVAVMALGIFVVAVFRKRRGEADARSARPLMNIAGGFGLANVLVAVVWP